MDWKSISGNTTFTQISKVCQNDEPVGWIFWSQNKIIQILVYYVCDLPTVFLKWLTFNPCVFLMADVGFHTVAQGALFPVGTILITHQRCRHMNTAASGCTGVCSLFLLSPASDNKNCSVRHFYWRLLLQHLTLILFYDKWLHKTS